MICPERVSCIRLQRAALLLGSLLWLTSQGINAAATSTSPPPVSTPLSELEPLSVSQGWGELQADQSVWNKPLQIGDRKFAHGLGTHAHSELVYDLEQGYQRFEAWVGVDAAVQEYEGASVTFQVFADGSKLFDSGLMRADTPAKHVRVSVAGVNELTLVVTDAGDGINADHADWAEAVLLGRGAPVRLPAPGPAKFTVGSSNLTIELSDRGDIVGASLGHQAMFRAIQGGTALIRCTDAGTVSARELTGGGVEFTRQVIDARSGQRAIVMDRFLPAKDSVRWEVEIRGEGAPWSTGIETSLRWPTNTAQFWTAWDDPEQRADSWHDPLALRPFVTTRLWYGTPHWDEVHPQTGYHPGFGHRFVIPILTLAEPRNDLGLSLVLSPEDALLEMSLTAHKDGAFTFRRNDHRISRTNTVRFAMDLVAQEADWRAGLGWMTRHYAAFFNPPNPRVREVAGLGAYSDWEGALDSAKLKRMGFQVNWKASYDFPYMGMFLPPISDDERYPRLVKGNTTSIQQLSDYSTRMRRMGFHVLNYFNVTEFGATRGMPNEPDPSLAPADRWKNVHNFMRDEVADGVLLDLKGRSYPSWEGCVAMDCGGPKYHAFLLSQARRHIEKLPDSDGICIDRMDWLRFYNFHADDGQSWRHDQPCRSLYSSWRELMSEMGRMFHAADKVIFVNALVNRLELLRHVDGIYHEFGHAPDDLNGAALACVRKPCIAWTPNENTLKPDPDAYFQRHLYLGVYPTAPLPENDHTIRPSAWADLRYLDYGPLFDALRGRIWVLQPHVISVQNGMAKANLFAVPGGYVVPVTFGGQAEHVVVQLNHLLNLRSDGVAPLCQVLQPGSEKSNPVPARFQDEQLILHVPLQRGCAMVRIQSRH